MGKLDGKTALVTGGALGIGKATCQLLAKEGATVVVTDLKDEEGQAVAAQIEKQGGSAMFMHLDVSDPNQVEAVFGTVGQQNDGLDILVNNAGIAGPNKPTHEVTPEEWDSLMAVNVRGVFLCTRFAVPLMLKRDGGSIINLSSIYGLIGAEDLPAYHASKGAVRIMSKTDALFYAKKGIRVNSVHPGYIWTPLVANLARESGEDPEDFRQQLGALHPVGHVGEPDDIAYGILYLASDESRFVTGSELVIDGGYTAQ